MARVRGTVPTRDSRALSTPPTTDAEGRLRLLAHVGRIMVSDLGLFEMLQKTADAIHELMGFANVDVPLLDEADERTLVIRVRGGSYKSQIRHEDRISIDRGVMGAAVRERRTQRVNDVAADPRYVQPPSGLTMKAELAVPILHSGRPLGVVNVEGPEPFSPLDVELLEMVADYLAIAIGNRRFSEQERRVAVVEERQRLARDLHDSVTQLLFSSTLLAESLPILFRRDAAAAESKLAQLLELNRRALGEMRALLRELAPANRVPVDFSSRELPAPSFVVLHRQGLVEALRMELQAVEAQGIGVRLEAATYERQSREREEMLLRVAQEALANVSKHAGATEVSVTLISQPHEVRLAVRDNGRGFDARRAIGESGAAGAGGDRSRGGLGIASMRERLRAHSGELQLESAPGHGTHVEVRLPR
jgi:two-component system NarL family sensor kinase